MGGPPPLGLFVGGGGGGAVGGRCVAHGSVEKEFVR